jgi:hypothetical protein
MLPADVEGESALLVDKKKPEVVKLPSLAPTENVRRIRLALAVGDDGAVAGTGELVFAGHHAVVAIHEAEAPKLVETWQKWLEERLPGFRIDAVEVTPAVESSQMRLTWKMAQHEEEVLGDEVTLSPSRPLGPVTQVLTLPPAQRLTPVVLPFADRDELALELSYPEGWRVEALPATADVASDAGALRATATVD